MIPCTLQEVAARSGGERLRGAPELEVRRLHTDTRTLQAGDCYVALKGEKFDGHDFIARAAAAGAAAAMVHAPAPPGLPEAFGVVRTEDTLLGLQRFAAAYRASLPVLTIGVTGSSGKTSTKEMIAAVLRRRFRTHATVGNLNNHVGVPLTLLALDRDHEYGVIEMGMNHPGEIAPLVRMAQPVMAAITNIGTAHIEFFEGQEGIAREKGEIIAHLPADGVAVLNADDPLTPLLRERTRARVVLAGIHEKADWRAASVSVTAAGLEFDLIHGGESVRARLPVFSRPMVTNGLMAAAIGGACGMPLDEIGRGLSAVELPGHRMKVISHGGRWIINDAYNANADSMRAALQALREFPAAGRRIAVLGSMGELGARSADLHRQVGREAARHRVDALIAVGPSADELAAGAEDAGLPPDRVARCPDRDAALDSLAKVYRHDGDCVLVKGSRFMELDKLVAALTGAAEGGGH